jgi:cation-transporting ATPase 13A1
LHALFFLMGHWIVAFKAVTLFKPATKVEDDCMVLITPPPNRGQPALVPIKKATGSGSINTPYVEFQRQKYMYISAAKLGSDNAKKYKNGVFSLTAYPVALPIDHYLQASGIPSEGEVVKLTEKWGKNHLAVAIPSFLELLKLQLLSPLAIFQVFCAILWLLDEYWSYTFFTLVSVVMYEATTVFQRTRTQQMLGGMSPKPSPVYVYRANKWSIITTKDLLPGDIISLSFKKRANANKPNLLPAATPTNTNTNTVTAPGKDNSAATATTNVAEDEKKAPITSRDDIVPCDCLLLRGSAVVNEASLTGKFAFEKFHCFYDSSMFTQVSLFHK